MAHSIIDLYVAKLPSAAVSDAEISKIVPPELLAGVRMDINRPFGAGRDTRAGQQNDYGVADQATDGNNETLQKNQFLSWPSQYSSPITLNQAATNGNNAGDPLLTNGNIPPGWKSRQLLARHLYSLMMLFTDLGYIGWINPNEQLPSTVSPQDVTARRIAQWAINAVCYRDSTSAMTPFVYHSHLFQSSYTGWTANGDPSQAGQGDLAVVWGCKPPDAVLTETFACHDKRAADTVHDGNNDTSTYDMDMTKRDSDFDQVRVPEGSLFLEVYCCRNPSNPVAPGDLYTYQNGQWYLDLGRNAPDGSPVWRMAISENARAGGNANANAAQQVANHPETVCFQSNSNPSLGPGTVDTVTQPFKMVLNQFDSSQNCFIERIVWLGSDHSKLPANTNVFYNRSGTALVAPGAYAVVGPRATTAIGATGAAPYGTPASQTIKLSPGAPNNQPQVTTTGTSGGVAATDIKAQTAIIVAADQPNSQALQWTKHPNGIGLNVSEPLPQPSPPTAPQTGAYYPEPTTNNPANNQMEFYGTDPTNGPFLDHPLDYGTGDPGAASRPLTKDGVANTGTYPFYKMVYLQRLADPTLPWDAVRNPYITVDWMPIDLNTFNGEEIPVAGATTGNKGADPMDANFQSPSVQFSSRQRGNSQLKNPIPSGPNLWAQVLGGDPLPGGPGANPPATTTRAAGSTDNFPYQLTHTFAYLNQGYGAGYPAMGAPSPQYVGDPQKPFPWINWNARPYVSVMELLDVPASAPDRFLVDFATPGTAATPPTAPPNPYDPNQPRAIYTHLLNFFNTKDTTYAPQGDYFMALEFMTVPSRFIGTETYFNPNVFSNIDGFLPPYNTFSNYRDPGKLNLNTMTSIDELRALLNLQSSQEAGIQQFWADFCNSRTGNTTGQVVSQAAGMPTGFANPFRSGSSADLTPLPAMAHRAVDVTLLRPSPNGSSTTTGGVPQPLFAQDPAGQQLPGTQQPYNDTTRNPYFKYQTLQRIANNVTTRSNVFAVWLTIGYFEALPNTIGSGGVDAGHPDGYMLGAELGSATGEIERHRAFYIFDRSIPVGYERGQNHNVNRAILLKRFIE
jgi:hypothetical protein